MRSRLKMRSVPLLKMSTTKELKLTPETKQGGKKNNLFFKTTNPHMLKNQQLVDSVSGHLS